MQLLTNFLLRLRNGAGKVATVKPSSGMTSDLQFTLPSGYPNALSALSVATGGLTSYFTPLVVAPWFPLILQNGWQSLGTQTLSACYFEFQNASGQPFRFVALRGSVLRPAAGISPGIVITNLPVGYRPAFPLSALQSDQVGAPGSRIDIAPNGDVTMFFAASRGIPQFTDGNTYTSLNLMFPAF